MAENAPRGAGVSTGQKASCSAERGNQTVRFTDSGLMKTMWGGVPSSRPSFKSSVRVGFNSVASQFFLKKLWLI